MDDLKQLAECVDMMCIHLNDEHGPGADKIQAILKLNTCFENNHLGPSWQEDYLVPMLSHVVNQTWDEAMKLLLGFLVNYAHLVASLLNEPQLGYHDTLLIRKLTSRRLEVIADPPEEAYPYEEVENNARVDQAVEEEEQQAPVVVAPENEDGNEEDSVYEPETGSEEESSGSDEEGDTAVFNQVYTLVGQVQTQMIANHQQQGQGLQQAQQALALANIQAAAAAAENEEAFQAWIPRVELNPDELLQDQPQEAIDISVGNGMRKHPGKLKKIDFTQRELAFMEKMAAEGMGGERARVWFERGFPNRTSTGQPAPGQIKQTRMLEYVKNRVSAYRKHRLEQGQ